MTMATCLPWTGDSPVRFNFKMAKKTFFYGWTVVGICTIAMKLGYGFRHSFTVFFLPSSKNSAGAEEALQ